MEPFGTARLATEGAVGFDCAATLHSGAIAAFAAAGFTFACRYVSRGEESSRDLQASEVAALHAHGLAVVVVQHVAVAPWTPSADLGLTLGHEAAADAVGIGCPAGVVLWADLEGVAASVKPSEILGFCNSWCSAVEAKGYESGIYVGANCGLNATELYRLLTVRRYWKSLSRAAPSVDVRGFQIIQKFGGTLAGIDYDRDTIAKDGLGSLPVWWAA